MKLCCVFSLESPHRGDSNSTHNIPFLNMRKKIILNYSKSVAMGFFQGNQERVRNSRGKRAISVRAIEVLLYFYYYFMDLHHTWVYGWADTLSNLILIRPEWPTFNCLVIYLVYLILFLGFA